MRSRSAVAFIKWTLALAAIVGGGIVAYPYLLQLTRPQVTVTQVVEGPVVAAFYATGTLLPVREYPIKANAPGIVHEVYVDKGHHVTKDQPLVFVFEDSVQQRFEQAKAERDQRAKLANPKNSPILGEYDSRLIASSDMLQIAQREQKRVTDLLEREAATQQDLDRAMDRVKMMWSEVEQLKAQKATKQIDLQKELDVAEAALKIAQWNLDRQTVRSPIESATILDWPVTVGTRVAVNDKLMQIADVRPDVLVMRAAVDEEDKVHVSVGQLVRMTLYAYSEVSSGRARVFEGHVKKIYDKADPDRRTFEVDVEVSEKDPGFSAGMTGELAFIITEKPSALVIPSQAVQAGDVWIVRDGQLIKPDVKLGIRSIERSEVLSGLKVGDQVVISPLENAIAGARVRTRYTEPVQAANLNKPKAEKAFQKFN